LRTSRPGRFSLKKECRYPLNLKLGGVQGRCGRFEEEECHLPLRGFESLTVQSVALLLYLIHFNIINSSTPRYPKKISSFISHLPVHDACHVNIIVYLIFFTRVQECKSSHYEANNYVFFQSISAPCSQIP